jgi:hypothetical protein
MGLDITAYKQLTKVGQNETGEYVDENFDDGKWECRLVNFTEKQFPGRTEGLEQGAVYSYGDEFDFHAGSYGCYNAWRNELAMLAGFVNAAAVWALPDGVSGLFVELINFSDCEGVIGYKVAAKLAKDFADFEAKAATHADEYFRQQYAAWARAFAMAAQNGAVEFH